MEPAFRTRLVELYHADCRVWLRERDRNSIHAVVTDPPYGMLEYSRKELAKLRAGRGGVWRIPPTIGGSKRAPVPRFTVLSESELTYLLPIFRGVGGTTASGFEAGWACRGCNQPSVQSRCLAGTRECRLREAGRDRPTGADAKRRRPAERGRSGVCRCKRYAAFLLGAVAALSKALRRHACRQLAQMGCRSAPAAFCGRPLYRRDRQWENAARREGDRPTPELEASGIPATIGPCCSPARGRRCSRSLRGQWLHAGGVRSRWPSSDRD